jgi:cation:H+ antiporter
MSALALDAVILFVALLFILGAAELFTNGIEWLGQHLGLSEGVVGSVLAAVGTALPETLIPIVAVTLFSGQQSHEVGIGAIAGAPFMLTTLTFSLCGTAVWLFTRSGKRSTNVLQLNEIVIARDLSFFIGCYSAALLATLLTDMQGARYAVAIALLGAYALYLRATFAHEGESGEAPEHLHLDWLLKSSKALWAVVAQVVLGLIGILGGSFLFVKYTTALSTTLHVHPLVLSLIIAPIATELPEKVNSVLWARNGKDTLALGNISGALVFQSCFPVAFGVAFTDWELNNIVLTSGITAIVVASFLLVLVKMGRLKFYHLMLGGIAYAGTVTYIIISGLRSAG